ncbi:MAG: hypothetical protein HYS08_10330 [Chlamydiae bacterium]|nr:hypothetical protein [Chlamydiota bacterium]MBI3266522.1 hypothetical protein [Chlamydiota bacterium]
MIQVFRSKFFKEKFFQSGVILFVASSVANLASYFYQFTMSRLMAPHDFGALNSLLSLFAMETVAVAVIGMVMVKYISQFQARQEGGKLRLFLLNSLRNLTLLGMFLGILVFITRLWMGRFLVLESALPLLILAVMVFMSFVLPVGTALLQGLQLFVRLGWTLVAGGISRLLFGILLVGLGLGVNGGLLANFLAAFPPILFFCGPLQRILKTHASSGPVERHTREILLFSIPVTLTLLGCAGLVNLDLILVKHFFLPELAGQYAAAVILGRSIFYFPGSLAMAMYPMVNEAHALEKDAHALLKRCLLWTGVLSLGGLLLFVAFPDFLIRFLFGEQYPQASRLLPIYAFSMLPLALSNVLVQFNLGLRKYGFIYMILGACLLEWVFVSIFHKSFRDILIILNVIEWFLVGVLLVMGFSKQVRK